jgi:CRP-like cAMP-binding protein
MSKLDDVVVPLLGARIFSGLSPAQLKKLALEAEPVSFKKGDAILRAYQEGDGAYLIGSGSVFERPEADDDDTPPGYGAGTMLGEMAMLVETLHSSTIIARTPVRALKFTRSAMLGLMADDPELAAHFVEKLRQRLAQIANKLREVDAAFDGSRPASEGQRVQ